MSFRRLLKSCRTGSYFRMIVCGNLWSIGPAVLTEKMFLESASQSEKYSRRNNSVIQGAIKGTDLRGQTESKRTFSQIFADFCRFSPFPRKQSIWEAQIFAGTRRFSQIGVRPLKRGPGNSFGRNGTQLIRKTSKRVTVIKRVRQGQGP